MDAVLLKKNDEPFRKKMVHHFIAALLRVGNSVSGNELLSGYLGVLDAEPFRPFFQGYVSDCFLAVAQSGLKNAFLPECTAPPLSYRFR